jgi:CubicO group peptidase (beta-lactamase class C family)
MTSRTPSTARSSQAQPAEARCLRARRPRLTLVLGPLLVAACSGGGTDGASPTTTTQPSTTTTTTPTVVSLGFPSQPEGVPYPTVAWPEGPWPEGVDRAAVDDATDIALAGGADERVRAVVIVHRGQLVYERYSPNADDGAAVVMPSYSIAKSITSAMIGMLVRDGRIDIDAPAAIPEWQDDPEDPRTAITPRHLLQMTSGLAWVDGLDPGSNMLEMLGRDDAAAYVTTRPLADPPGTTFLYNTGGTMLLARLLADEVGSGDQLRAFLDSELFGKLGMDPVETDFDSAGTWLGGVSADTTARNLAKFGLLYARGGSWDGEQLLPEEWVELSRTPSAANPEYGAGWWLDPLRPEVLYAIGARGQVITVDPGHDLVIVQLSTVGGQLPLAQTEAILGAFAAADQ